MELSDRLKVETTSITLLPTSLAGYDCVLIATNHSAYDWQLVADNARLVIDTRGAMRHIKGRRDHIVPA